MAKKVSGGDDDEEIPTLVPIGTPAKKVKVEVSTAAVSSFTLFLQ